MFKVLSLKKLLFLYFTLFRLRKINNFVWLLCLLYNGHGYRLGAGWKIKEKMKKKNASFLFGLVDSITKGTQ